MKLIKEENQNIAAVDIGGTNTRFCLFDKNGKIKLKDKIRTSFDSAHQICNWIIRRLQKYEIEYLALCIPGPSDYANGFIINPPNLQGKWHNFDMKKYLLDNSKLKDIVFENDANVMALSNHFENNKTKNDITQFYTISTGFGSGLIINNKIYHGNNYYAQEIAQIPISPAKFEGENHFNNPFALELHCSGKGIELKAKHLGISNSTKEVFELANKNNPLALQIINDASDALSRMFAINAAILAPTSFFIGGSVALNNNQFVVDAFEKAKQMSDAAHFKNVDFGFDKNGDDSALYGLYYLIKTIF